MKEFIGFFVVPLIIAIMIAKYIFRSIVVYEYEKGVQYHKGKFVKVLDAGKHWFIRFSTSVIKVDIRPRFTTIPGQELISSDGVTLKVSLAANFEVVDPAVAINKVQNYADALYVELQIALREIIGNANIDDVLEKRNEFSKRLLELTESKAQVIGLKLHSINIKDIMFPGELKQMFAQIVKARKEGLAALEKTRGETAALRNLLNAAKLLEGNPLLVQLRAMQSSGNTFVFGMPSNITPIAK